MTNDAGLREALAALLAEPEHFGLLADDGEPYEPEWWQEKADAILADPALRALATPTPAPAEDLDVERLARAMAVAWPTSFRGYDSESDEAKELLRRYALVIAREYAALQAPEPAP